MGILLQVEVGIYIANEMMGQPLCMLIESMISFPYWPFRFILSLTLTVLMMIRCFRQSPWSFKEAATFPLFHPLWGFLM